MQVRYLNGITQLHPLQATIACPSFKTSVDNLIFKPSFVGQEVHHLVTIYNRSGADTRWKARVQGLMFKIRIIFFKLNRFLKEKKAFYNVTFQELNFYLKLSKILQVLDLNRVDN